MLPFGFSDRRPLQPYGCTYFRLAPGLIDTKSELHARSNVTVMEGQLDRKVSQHHRLFTHMV